MQLVDPAISDRPLPRFVAPAPALSPEKTEQLLTQQGARGRKMASRMKQGQLPLEILAKGRFDLLELFGRLLQIKRHQFIEVIGCSAGKFVETRHIHGRKGRRSGTGGIHLGGTICRAGCLR